MRPTHLILILPLSGCLGLLGLRDSNRDEPVQINVSDNFETVTDQRPLELFVEAFHPSGSEVITSGRIVTRDGESVTDLQKAVGDEWTGTLTFDMLNAIDPISTEVYYTDSFDLVAVFTTRWDVESTEPFVVDVRCAEGVACDGRCTDLANDPDHCGTCGDTSCLACDDGACVGLSNCYSGVTANERSPEEMCASEGRSCATAPLDGIENALLSVYADAACTEPGDVYAEGYNDFVYCDEVLTYGDGTYVRFVCAD